MGNTSQKQTNSLLDKQRATSAAGYNPAIDEARKRSESTYYDSQARIPGLDTSYENMMKTGGFDPSDFDALRATYGGGGGGSSVASSLAGTGGIDPSVFGGALKGYEEFASGGGGIDAEGFRNRANRVIPSFYRNVANESRRRALVNPYNPSFDSSQANLARNEAQQAQENVRDTETTLSQLASENRKYGISGLGSLNTAIQDMIQRGKIAGGNQEIANAGLANEAAGRKTSAESHILDLISSGRIKGLEGMQGLQTQQAGQGMDYFRNWLAGLGGRDEGQLGAINARQNTVPWWQKLIGPVAGAAGAFAGAKG